jgi:CRISP-associated protein Cas1
MAWRGLHLSQASRLSLADGQLVVGQDDGEVRVALEDIAWIVLDTPRATLTSALLSACMAAGIVIVATDATHCPSGLVLPFHQHHRQAEIARLQVESTLPLKKRLWQTIIQTKITNQAAALNAVGAEGHGRLKEMAARVGSGDPENLEAQAARYYWSKLWPAFRREDEGDHRNKLLNYGYAVIRAGIARALVATGLLPAFGVQHASVSNAFNLADDLVEPFRPFVDLLAHKLADGGRASRDGLSLSQRQALAGVLLAEARMGRDALTLLSSAERAAESLVRCFEGRTPVLLQVPVLPP